MSWWLKGAPLRLLQYWETEDEGVTQSRTHRHGERGTDSGEFFLALVMVGEMKGDPPGWMEGGGSPGRG